MYVCICSAVTDREVREVVDRGASSLGELQMHLPVGACCGRCVEACEEVIDAHRRAQNDPAMSQSAIAESARAA